MNNKVTATLNSEDIARIKELLAEIQNSHLPFLIELSPAESKSILHMEAARVDFVQNAFVIATNNENSVPTFMNWEKWKRT